MCFGPPLLAPELFMFKVIRYCAEIVPPRDGTVRRSDDDDDDDDDDNGVKGLRDDAYNNNNNNT